MSEWAQYEPLPFDSFGGGVHPTSRVGGLPELRDWRPGDPLLGPLVHRTARIHAYVTIDCGVHRHPRVGARSWIMAKVHLGHDVTVGEDVEIAPGSVIAGDCTIEDGVKIGIGCSVRPRVTIGAGARLAAGAVVIRDVPAGEIHGGCPAKRIVHPGQAPVDVGELEHVTVVTAPPETYAPLRVAELRKPA